jgi:hypothetical protein
VSRRSGQRDDTGDSKQNRQNSTHAYPPLGTWSLAQ